MTPVSEARHRREQVLAASRWVGWMLAAAVIAAGALGVASGLQAERQGRALGQAHARAFIDKVRACHRAPKPHPSWTECERQVQAGE